MTDPQLLARIDENVKYLRVSFDEHKQEFREHVQNDNRIVTEIINPLWDSHQQQKGAINLGTFICSIIASALTLLTASFSGLIK